MCAAACVKEVRIASLWNGYGSITRQTYADGSTSIKKLVASPASGHESDESHTRKLRSYQVERYFYRELSEHLDVRCKVAKLYSCGDDYIIMEDLSRSYSSADHSQNLDVTFGVLSWLASFHSSFWNYQGPTVPHPLLPIPATCESGVWAEGGYWYLSTRLDDLSSIPPRWRSIAHKVDEAIANIPHRYKTLVHGDCKSANIMLDAQSRQAALYDFQYVGLGPGVRDVVYFLVSSVRGVTGHTEHKFLQHYYDCLRLKPDGYTFAIMLQHYELCMVDYYRFLLGWGMWGDVRFIQTRVRQILCEAGEDDLDNLF